jgi:hypothetical protein
MTSKKNNSIVPLAALITLLCFAACTPSIIKEPKSYMEYLADPSNGLVKERTVAGIKYKVKYLPSEYLVYKTLGSVKFSKAQRDSVLKQYDNSVSFLLNIGPAENESFDITRVGVADYEEFMERIERMSFESQEWITVRSNNKEYKPGIARMENINALEKSRNIIVVFSTEKNTGNDIRKDDMCFTYNDELFNTGTNKFIFKKSDIEKLPEFEF